MMMDLVMELLTAADDSDRREAYCRLERIGIDRYTADCMAEEFYDRKEQTNEE